MKSYEEKGRNEIKRKMNENERWFGLIVYINPRGEFNAKSCLYINIYACVCVCVYGWAAVFHLSMFD